MAIRFTPPVLLAATLVAGCAGGRMEIGLQAVQGHPSILVEAGYQAGARRVAGLLPQVQAQVVKRLGQGVRRPVRLRICGSRHCMAALARNPDRHAESTRDGLLLGPGAFRPGVNLRALLAHELVHALFRQQLGRRYWRVPAWFHEGVAVWLSGSGGEGVSDATARREMTAGNHFTFYCRRDPFGFNRSFRPGGQLYYRQAAMFVREIGRSKRRFRALVTRVLADADLCRAYQRVYGRDLRTEWRRFRGR